MLQVGDNILNGVLVRVIVDPETGRTKVYIPVINSPSPDPVADYDPAITLSFITAFVMMLLANVGL